MASSLSRLVGRRYASAAQLAHCRQRGATGLRPWERSVLSFHQPWQGRWLDIGCGSGREALALGERGHDVIGLDTSPEQLGQARTLLASRQMPADLVRTGGITLPFRDAAFAHVLLWSQLLANVPTRRNRARLLSECRRVLAAGGKLSLSVHDRETTLASAAGLVLPAQDGLEDGDYLMMDSPETATPCYWHYFTRPEILTLCRGAGLVVHRCTSAAELGDPDRANLWVCECERAAWEPGDHEVPPDDGAS